MKYVFPFLSHDTTLIYERNVESHRQKRQPTVSNNEHSLQSIPIDDAVFTFASTAPPSEGVRTCVCVRVCDAPQYVCIRADVVRTRFSLTNRDRCKLFGRWASMVRFVYLWKPICVHTSFTSHESHVARAIRGQEFPRHEIPCRTACTHFISEELKLISLMTMNAIARRRKKDESIEREKKWGKASFDCILAGVCEMVELESNGKSHFSKSKIVDGH